MIRDFAPGMGQAVAERTILRKLNRGTPDERFETWEEVSNRVALGNALLTPDKDEIEAERRELLRHLLKVNVTMSGRHLQHGDIDQPDRTQECFTNCSTSATSFMMFYLLMSGSGVGRCYDDDLMLVDWDYAPNLRCVLADTHADFNYTLHESVREATHKYGVDNPNVIWHTVDDSREGWAKAVELYERLTFEKVHKDKILVLDFSPVRCKGSPIHGMQDRPASGPAPLMNAFVKVASLKGAKMPLWMQAMYVDHFLAECVLVGGARRSARMSVKSWRDKSVVDFIQIKRPIEFYGKDVEEVAKLRLGRYCEAFLWSSNNSVLVDKEFWRLIDIPEIYPEYQSDLAMHARKVFELVTSCAYGDGTGEPGLINQDELVDRRDGYRQMLSRDNIIGSSKYALYPETKEYLTAIVDKLCDRKYVMIVNPCVVGDTIVHTEEGMKRVVDLVDKSFTAIVNGEKYRSEGGFCLTGVRPVIRLTAGGRTIKLTDNHAVLKVISSPGVCTEAIWTPVSELSIGNRIVLASPFAGHDSLVDPDAVVNIETIEFLPEEQVYDCRVERIRCFEADGFLAHNCSEIALFLMLGFCTIGDVCPYFADTLDEAEAAFRAMTRALIRVNLMDSVYNAEVRRTNRIGVAITGIHEFAWKFFGLSFYDLIDENRSKPFWLTLARFNRAVRDEAEKYCRKYGLPVPHTLTTIKPSGTMSKLWGLTEGWHLPAMAWYLRWVQFHEDDPLIAQYSQCGYPTRALRQYKNTVIVGFPTEPLICRIGADIVLAGEASMDDQYQWLRLGEKYWIKGTDKNGKPLEDDRGNQVSYTIKYNPRNVSFDAFQQSLRDNQRTVRCCSVMPQEDGSSYEYLPEQPISEKEFKRLMGVIEKKTADYFRDRKRTNIVEDIDPVHIACENGACPVDFKLVK